MLDMFDALMEWMIEWARMNIVVVVPFGFMMIMIIIIVFDIKWRILDDPKPKSTTQPNPLKKR